MENHTRLVVHGFKGPRFEDNGLDLDVLPELVVFRTILLETAKDLWRANHPGRERLPRNYEDDFQLKIYALEGGSVQAPICRPYSGLLPIPDELDEAVELVTEVIDCASKGLNLPDKFPRRLLPLFAGYGKTLRSDEYFEYKTARGKSAEYTDQSRQFLVSKTGESYESSVDLQGTIIGARVLKPRMLIQLDDGREIEADFDKMDEPKVLEGLVQHEDKRVRLIGSASYSVDGIIQRITSLESLDVIDVDVHSDFAVKPIWEQIEELTDSLSPELFDSLPKDGAKHHDRYLYGSGS